MEVRELLEKLERTIDTLDPERGEVPIKMLGFGEISLVFELLDENARGRAYKRLPIFSSEKQVELYGRAYDLYNRLLERAGMSVPESSYHWFKSPRGAVTLYCEQEKVDPRSVGNKVIHQVSDAEVARLVLLVLGEMEKLWEFNADQERTASRGGGAGKHWVNLGLDGQISNWAVVGFDPGHPAVSGEERLLYLDTSTPLFRMHADGKSVYAFNPELFLKSAPSFLRWLLKYAFLGEVVERYHDPHKVIVDLVANFFKEQKPRAIPHIVKVVNEFLASGPGEKFGIEPLTLKEVQAYYKSDKQIWVIFQGVRRFDRFLQTRVFKRPYEFYLPGKIDR
ncbi:MAG: DUF6206 family protein [Promethearchaeota archaeon]